MRKSTLSIILKEFLEVRIYITALLIGLVINWTTLGSPVSSWIPFAVPLFVQIFSRCMLKIQYQSKEQLLLLPSLRKDPSFIMDKQGKILYSEGNTRALLECYDIKNINHFSDEDILSELNRNLADGCDSPVELYFDPGACWYEINSLENPKNPDTILVWFTNISATKEMIRQLQKVQSFSQHFQVNLDEPLRVQDTLAQMAELVISNQYSSVFIAEKDEGAYAGKVFKLGSKGIVVSDLITVEEESEAPLLASRKEHGLVSGNLEDFPDRDAFFERFPFDAEVRNFLGEEIRNFINFHSGDLSLIAFNHQSPTRFQDRIAMEIQVNTAWTIKNLQILVQENKDRFTQSIEGLCAASEFSDEITGSHIYRVNAFSAFIAEKMGLSPKEIEVISQVAAIHDIGKVAVPHLVKLQRAFTSDERLQMQMHAVYGAQILKKMMEYGREDENLKQAYTIALCHHQQWNGNGYPGIKDSGGEWSDFSSRELSYYKALTALTGEEIPGEALIVSLADRYDALRSERQYKKGYSHEEALAILSRDDRSGESGEEIFGPRLFAVLQAHHKGMEEIFEAMKD